MNASTRRLSATAIRPGTYPRATAKATRRGNAPCATSRPRAPPARNSSTLSTSICRTSRPRLAPSAVRIRHSLERARPRANKRFVTFAQAIRMYEPHRTQHQQEAVVRPGGLRDV